VLLVFFFFGALFLLIVVAHRIDWYGREAIRGTCDLDAAGDDVVSLLSGAINDRGCAIVLLRDRQAAVIFSKVHRSFGRAKTTNYIGIHTCFTTSANRALVTILLFETYSRWILSRGRTKCSHSPCKVSSKLPPKHSHDDKKKIISGTNSPSGGKSMKSTRPMHCVSSQAKKSRKAAH
jgi:hypothetical protein